MFTKFIEIQQKRAVRLDKLVQIKPGDLRWSDKIAIQNLAALLQQKGMIRAPL